MAMAMNFFIPNVEEFFQTMLSFNQSNACLELGDGDQAEFLSRRLEQYEQTFELSGASRLRGSTNRRLSSSLVLFALFGTEIEELCVLAPPLPVSVQITL